MKRRHPSSCPESNARRLPAARTRFRAMLITLLSLLLFTAGPLLAREVPFLSAHVVDEAGLLSEAGRNQIEEKLALFERQTSNQLAVLIVPSLEGDVLEEYSLRVAETWKLGQADLDNGVLLLVAVQDRKMRIEVGYGLEGDLTDALSSRIIRNEIAPRFREQDFDSGILNGVEAIIQASQGSYTPEDSQSLSESGPGLMPWPLLLIFGGVFLIVVGTFTALGFFTPGGAGWFLYIFLIPFWFAFPIAMLGVPIGLSVGLTYLILMGLARIFFSFTKRGQQFHKKYGLKGGSGSGGGSYSSSSSGWSSSSSSGWSSGSSGGFSGGGGSFGGGGSSGSW